jgi:hypothetical protein
MTAFFVLSAILVENAVRTKRQLDMLLWGVVAAGAAVSLYGIYQYVFKAWASIPGSIRACFPIYV